MSLKFPTVIVSSVIRSTYQGESHGGVYLLNLETNDIKQVIDWNDQEINWNGRGGDRGLRGIAFYDNKIFLAASNEIFVYDTEFNLIKSFSNPYLQHCHEIFINDHKLFLTSTGFDSILEFDLTAERFVQGYHFRYGNLTNRKSMIIRLLYRLRVRPTFKIFDPNSTEGPVPADTLHINNVCSQNDAIYFSGVNIGNIFAIKGNMLTTFAKIPFKTHNAMPCNGKVIVNDTANDQILRLDKSGHIEEVFKIKMYEQTELSMTHLPHDHARQGFGRGLCKNGGLLIGGSSPASVSVYKLGMGPHPLKTVNISMDVRNAVHGLEVWPF